jgi:hypothetical protein
MFDDGVKCAGLEGELAVKDLAEIVAELIIMKDEETASS